MVILMDVITDIIALDVSAGVVCPTDTLLGGPDIRPDLMVSDTTTRMPCLTIRFMLGHQQGITGIIVIA